MSAILEMGGLGTRHLQKRLVDERGGLECLTRFLLVKRLVSQTAKIRVGFTHVLMKRRAFNRVHVPLFHTDFGTTTPAHFARLKMRLTRINMMGFAAISRFFGCEARCVSQR